MAKYVKLGEAAKHGSFYCSVTGLSLVPGTIAKVPKDAETSKIYKEAIKGGHLTSATQDEYNEFVAKKEEEAAADKKSSKKAKPSLKAVEVEEDEEEETEEDEDDEDIEEDEDDPETMTISELTEALKNSDLPEEVKKTLGKMKKPELVELHKKTIKE